ncbi:DUF3991 domain-containing protein [Tolypothrix bouteillei VB521301_2]
MTKYTYFLLVTNAEQLLLYQQQLKEERTTLENLAALMAQREQQLISQKAVDAIVNYIDSKAVESTFMETLPELTEQLLMYQQQLKVSTTTLNDFGAVITQQLQRLSSSSNVDVIALNKAQTLTPSQPKLTPNHIAELYKYYSADLHSLLVTDRDKEIAFRALLDNQPDQNVEEILLASPAGWTSDEAKALVLIANNRLATHKQQQQSKPQFTPPPEDESLRRILQYYLTQTRGLTNYLVGALQRQGLGYIDQQKNVVFIKRDLNGEKSGALVWDTHREDNRCMEYPENSDRFSGWFYLKLGGELDDKIERVILCDSPIEALSIAHIDRDAHKGQPPVRTMYMAVDDPNSLPLELLKNVNRIALAFNNDEQGNQTAQLVQKILPQAKRVEPSGVTWNEILIEAKQREIEQQKQRSRGFSR